MKIIYISNFLDEQTFKERGIIIGSNAASNKIMSICQALNEKGIDISILSLGFGKSKYKNKYFPQKEIVINNIRISYCSYISLPVLGHLYILISLFYFIIKFHSLNCKYLFYNSLIYYYPSLLYLKYIKKAQLYLDLEDWIFEEKKNFKEILNKILLKFAVKTCNKGTLLANSLMLKYIKHDNHLICHGVNVKNSINIIDIERKWKQNKINILYGGTLIPETGLTIFRNALQIMLKDHSKDLEKIHFIVTGIYDKTNFEKSFGNNNYLTSFDNLDKFEYENLLKICCIGLSLKTTNNSLGVNTFPSKIVEYTTNGLLLVTTVLEDIQNIFSPDEVFYLYKEDPESLAELFVKISNNKEICIETAKKGLIKSTTSFDQDLMGEKLLNFFK